MKHILIFMLLCLVSVAGHADNITLSGIVTSAATNKPIADAEVRVVGTRVSVITNEEGHFTLKLTEKPKTLKVIALGYRNAVVSTTDVADVEHITVRMHAQSYVLNPVTVYSADNIVMTALSKVKENYAKESECLSCFYRETIRKQNRYTGISEAVMNMYKSSYSNDIRRDKVQIMKGRSLVSQNSKDTLSVRVMGGPHDAVMLDLVKNDEVLFYKDDLPAYRFTMQSSTTIDDRQQYVISFEAEGVREYPLYNGTMYIDSETLAFTRIEASLDVSDKEKATRFMLVRKPRGLRFRPRAMNMTVAYHYDGECSRIHYVRTSYHFNCDWRRRLFATSFRATSEMVVTDYTPAPLPRGNRNMFGHYDILNAAVADFNDTEFWNAYNIIEPTESLENAVGKLKKRITK